MKTMLKKTFAAAVTIACAALASGASAQATRTWVSGVGDDANPCSRTAPCKTFAGAISKTASGGEINALDPSGYGTVTITKPITINGRGTMASILSSSVNGVTINIPGTQPSDAVYLRGIEINGAGTTPGTVTHGVRFLSGGALYIEDCDIYNMGGEGVDFSPSTGNPTLVINNSQLHHNTEGGVYLHPTGTATVEATINNVQMSGNGRGMRLEDGATALVRNSAFSSSTPNAGLTVAANTRAAVATVENSTFNGNAGDGLRSSGATAVVRVGSSTSADNGLWGLASPSGGQILSFGGNRVYGNAGGNGSPSMGLPTM